MTLQETRVEPPERIYDVEFPSLDALGSTVDLGRFERLSEAERRRIIIRVLCGLVAMEEAPDPTPAPRSVAPTPGPPRRLPFLGLETTAHKPTRPRRWTTALLPHLGPERAY